MILFYLNPQHLHHSRFIRSLYASYPGDRATKRLQSTARFLSNTKLNESADLIVFAGIIRGDGLIYKYCDQNNKNYLYLDHAYLYRGYNGRNPNEEWMRLTLNAFTWSKNQTESVDRWNQHFASSFSLSQWKGNTGKHILVLPPSAATKFLYPQSDEWMKKTINEISKKTNLPIKIREKPFQPVVDPITNNVTSAVTHEHNNPIEADMIDAKLIVTFNSAVPVMGTVLGYPCYCSPYAAAYPMNIDLDHINNPPEPDRQGWLNQLVYHQYTTNEMINGRAWKLLEKYFPKK
jgi:hypothetical protein